MNKLISNAVTHKAQLIKTALVLGVVSLLSLALFLLSSPNTVIAQAQIELPCPQGQSVMPNTQTFNNGTGKYRQWECVDVLGNVSIVSPSVGSLFPLLAPNGSSSAPSYSFSSSTNSGLTLDATPGVDIINTGVTQAQFRSGSMFLLGSDSATITFGLSADTNIGRAGVGILEIGTGPGATNKLGSLVASSYTSAGTTFTASGCGNTTLIGGASAGSYVSVTPGSCSITITMGDASSTAPHGWACGAHDITTLVDSNNVSQSSSTATTVTFLEGTVLANDVIVFSCTGY